MTELIPVERGNLQELFDIIVGSLDYGSGFLDQEQIEVLRRTAEQLGIDPIKATPTSYAKSYPHTYSPYVNPVTRQVGPMCQHCFGEPDLPCHAAEQAA